MTLASLRRVLHRSRLSRLDNILSEVGDALARLGESTETDFLEVGGKLEHIVSRSRQEAAQLAAMVENAAGSGSGVLVRILGEARDWAGGIQQESGGDRWFAGLTPLVAAAGKPVETLVDTVRVLRVLGVVTRVESARLGPQAVNFEALAAEVRNLADGIEEKAGALLIARREVAEMLERARATAAGEERRQQQGRSHRKPARADHRNLLVRPPRL
jgi:hypothetical protein